MKKCISIILVVSFSVMTVACAGVQVPIKTASDVRNLKVEDGYQYKYEVTFRDGTSQKFDDDQVDTKGNLIGVRGKNERDFRYYDSNDIVSVERKRKTHWGKGAAIGAGAGAAVLGGLTAGLAINAKNDPDSDMDGFGKPGVIALFAVGAAVVGGLIGMGVGGGIGGSIPKKKKPSRVKVNVSPKVYTTQKMKIQGAGVGISGSF